MMDMLTFLFDCAAAGTPSDEVPCTEKLSEIFGLKYKWVTSVCIAARNDVQYPGDMSEYGVGEAERKLNYFIRKYSHIDKLMPNYKVVEDLHGLGTTWFVRETLTYQSPVVSGPGWFAIGDACGFTNPLFSPGINVRMASSTYAAELTHDALSHAKVAAAAAAAGDSNKTVTTTAAESSIRETLKPYDDFTRGLHPSLDMMNRFLYNYFRDPRLGERVGFQQYVMKWHSGSQLPAYGEIARETIRLASAVPLGQRVPEAVVQQVLAASERIMAASFADNPAKGDPVGGQDLLAQRRHEV
ncbi:FADH2-dependent halogenase [Microdochium nivale]|nr:FADH2-dependent halogenase [Microdochium nivale]